ncbi:MAG TPA: diaminopimelate epimerase [Sphingobacteriaceae bacterium]|nr:diaminopimelate epimerase [Sphingobacteriaceae bacterium]
MVKFFKYQGAGNDFILTDNRLNSSDRYSEELIRSLCDRRFGIGADGVMALHDKKGYDFEMVYYNADGKPGSMCGNGGRCIVAFAKHLGIIASETNFLAVDGPHYAKISESSDWVSLQMNNLDIITRDKDGFVLDTGSPHYVSLVNDLKNKDVYTAGHSIRYNSTYADEGINVNFVEDLGDHYFVRTYERGVEDETFACGTGATAAAMTMAMLKELRGHINTQIKVLGGKLNIQFDYDGMCFTNVFLEGPATLVFEGSIDI